MSIELWLIGAGAVFLMVLVFEVWKDLIFIRLMLDQLTERRHRRELENRELEGERIRAKREAAAGAPNRSAAAE